MSNEPVKTGHPNAEYFRIHGHDEKLLTCALCGSTAELWEYKPGLTGPQKVAMCSKNGDEAQESCPFYMPPEDYYCATKREAISFWNKTRATNNDAEERAKKLLDALVAAQFALKAISIGNPMLAYNVADKALGVVLAAIKANGQNYYAPDGTLMNADGTRSIDEVEGKN